MSLIYDRRFTFGRNICYNGKQTNLKDLIVLAQFLGWWSKATLGTLFTIARQTKNVGKDEFGNRYFEAKTAKGSYDKGRKRRYVIYNGYADASKIPPDWHAWMHYLTQETPTHQTLSQKNWEKPHVPNMTGTPYATYPEGSLYTKQKRAQTTGDYEAWKP